MAATRSKQDAPDETVRRTSIGHETGTIRRVLMVLRDLVDHPGTTPASIASRLGLPRSTIHRLLAMLRADDFAATDTDGAPIPGPELYRMAGRLRSSIPYHTLAEPLLRELCDEFGETSLLVLIERRQLKMFCAASAAPTDPMRYNIELNRLESLAWGATGRAMLAYLPRAEIDAVIARGEPSPSDSRPLSATEVMRALAAIRRQGYAVTRSHRTRGAVGVAVPLFDAARQVLGSVALLIPEFRYGAHPLTRLVAALTRSSTALSDRFDHSAHAAVRR
jgi:DNA-binding IclR family transcriptional regulator